MPPLTRTLVRPAALMLAAALAFTSAAVRASQAPAVPDRSVWNGVFTADQAARGATLFASSCAGCHGAALQGTGEGKSLRGEAFWTDWRESTVDALLSYVSKNMPRTEDGSGPGPGSLAASNYADIVAHILAINELPTGGQELTAASSTGVRIIRKDGPGELPATTLATVVGCLEPRGADGSWRVSKATVPVRAEAAKIDPAASGARAYTLKFVLTPLTKFVGQRVAVTGLLLGDGGAEGINVSDVKSVAPSCS